MPIQPQHRIADAAADVPQPQSELTTYLLAQLARGIPHGELLSALLANFHSLATVHPCCTESAARSALSVGGKLLVSAIDRQGHTTH